MKNLNTHPAGTGLRQPDKAASGSTRMASRRFILACGVICVVALSACQTQETRSAGSDPNSRNSNDLLVVDCLLPAQIRKLGQNMTFLGPRRAIKTTGTDCEIRGGEYVSYDRADYATALKVWLPPAKQGDADAQVYVGEIYEKGLGVRADYQVAAAWYRKAAAQGNSRAQINLGYLHESGLGVPRDLTQAMNWYRKASGLTEGDLEFVSSVEAARRQAATQELSAMREETAQLRRRLGEAEARLANSRKSLETARRKAEQASRQSAVRSTTGPTSSTPASRQELARTRQESLRLQEALASQQNEAQDLRAQLERSQGALSEKQGQLAEAQDRLNRVREDLNQAKLAALGGGNEQTRKLQSQAKAQAQRVARQQEEIARLTERLARSELGKRDLEDKIAARETEAQTLESKLAQALRGNDELAKSQQRLQTSREERHRLTDQLAAVQLDAARLRRQEAQTQGQLTAMQERLDASERALGEMRASLSRQQSGQEAAGDEIASLQGIIAQREAELAKLRRETEELRGASAGQRSQAADALAAADRRRQELQTSLARKDKEIDGLSKRLAAALKDKAELQSVQQALASADAERRKLADRLARQQLEESNLGKELDQARRAVTAGNDQVASLQEAIRALAGQLSQRENQLGAQGERMEQLRSQVAEQAGVLEARRVELATLERTQAEQRATMEKRLADTLDAARRQRKELEDRRGRIDTLEQELASTQRSLAASERRAAELEGVESELEAQQAQVSRQEQEIERLRKALSSSQQTPATPAIASVVETREAGPSIEIIDPPLALTRGTPSILLRSPTRIVELIGRVRPENDLLAFKINQKITQLGNNGLFREKVSLRTPDTPVNIVAIDNSGNRTALDFLIVPPSKPKPVSTVQERAGAVTIRQGDVEFGTYHALIIGNQNYANMPSLETPANDAREMERVLRTVYGFNTRLLLDANRYQILSALNEMRSKLTGKDNLLIYFAGHGELDNVNLRGHWLPVDAEPESTANWISNVAITDILNAMAAKHILVVADSCYSGSMTRSSLARLNTGMGADEKKKWYRIMAKARARAVLTSGGLKPVLDSGGAGHSIFTRALLDVLRDNKQILEGYKLYREVQARVKREARRLNVDQDPQYAPIKFAGHEAGEFFFLPRSASAALPLASSLRLAGR